MRASWAMVDGVLEVMLTYGTRLLPPFANPPPADADGAWASSPNGCGPSNPPFMGVDMGTST